MEEKSLSMVVAERVTVMASDLVGLTCRPEREANISRNQRFGKDRWREVIHNKMSAAKSEILWEGPVTSKPLISVWQCMVSAKGSISKTNNKGERGQPCQVPLWIGNKGDSNL